MGLLAPVILGAVLIVAFALSTHQRLAIASPTGPKPARQIAYLMRVHHQAAIGQKLANPALDNDWNYAPPTMTNDDRIISCIYGKFVSTGLFTVGDSTTLMPLPVLDTAENDKVVAELRRQTLLPPELGRMGETPWSIGHNGAAAGWTMPATQIGLIGEVQPIGCPMPVGVPALVTQVIP